MITLALGQMIYFLAFQLPFTHAEDGLTAVPRGKLLGMLDLNNNFVLYYTAAVIFLAGYLLIYRITHSTFGQILKAIRENEPRMISLGYQVNNYKMLAFVLSATLAGLAGATKTMVVQLASPVDVHWATSGDVVLDGDVGRRRHAVWACGRCDACRDAAVLSRGFRPAHPDGHRRDLCDLHPGLPAGHCRRDQPADGPLDQRALGSGGQRTGTTAWTFLI